MIARSAVLLALALLARSAAADVKSYQNDSIGAGGQIACQAGFVANEIGASVYTVPAGDGLVQLLGVDFFVCDGSGLGFAQARPMQVVVYGSGGPNPGAALYTSPTLSGVPGFLNSWDTTSANLRFQPGQTFTVGVRLLNGTLFQNFSTLATDSDGCQSSKSLIFAVPGGWTDACVLGVSGDMIVRAKVLTKGPKQYGAGLAGAAGVPNIGSNGTWYYGSTSFAVTCSSIAAFAPGALAASPSPASLPLFGGTILIDIGPAVLYPQLSSGAGTTNKLFGLPGSPALAGLHVYFQHGFMDGAAVQGFSLSAGLDLEISSQ